MNLLIIKSFRQKILLVLLMVMVLVGCGRKSGKSMKSVFRYNHRAGISSMDPAFARNQTNIWAVNHLYDGLVRFDDKLNVKPSIAESWTVSDDGKVYTFKLRNDCWFHEDPCFEGKARRVVASDVKYSFERLLDPEIASPGAWIFRGKIAEDSAFTALSDSVFQIRLKQAFLPLMGMLTMQYCSIVPREAVEHYGNLFGDHPVGTGPFVLDEFRRGEALILKRNPGYHLRKGKDSLPFLDEVWISFIQNPTTEFLMFLDGQLEFVSDIDPAMKEIILNPVGNLQDKYSKNMRLFKAPYLNTEYLGINLQAKEIGILGNKNIRKALNLAIDRSKMVTYLRNGKGYPANKGMIGIGLPVYSKDAGYGYNFDPARARTLIQESGVDLKGVSLTLYAPPSYMDICEYLQQQWAEVGISVDLKVVQPGFLRTLVEKGEAPFFRASWIADYPDEESFLALFYSQYGSPPNYTHFSSQNFDQLYREALASKNEKTRRTLYRKMDSLVMDEAPVIPLYYDQVYRFVQTYVAGLSVNAMNLLDLREVRVYKTE